MKLFCLLATAASARTCLNSERAVDAEIVAPMVARNGYVWFEGNELKQKANTNHKGWSPKAAGGVTFKFDVKKAGKYSFSAELIAPNGNDNSFYVTSSVDHGSPKTWSTGRSTSWVWHKPPSTTGMKDTYFPAGTHSITLKPREDGTKVRALRVTNSAFKKNFITENVCFKTATPAPKPEVGYTCDDKKNFIRGQKYSQIALTDGCRNNVCNANPKYGGANSKAKAIAYCKKTCDSRSGCTGFFFQTHGNGHEICGFYTGSVNTGAAQWHGHKNGAVCTKSATKNVCKDTFCTYSNGVTSVFSKKVVSGSTEKWDCEKNGNSGCTCTCAAANKCALTHSGVKNTHC